MANAELQNLANAYATGALSQNEYRLQRAEILDRFSSDLLDSTDSPITRRLKRPTRLSFSSRRLSFSSRLLSSTLPSRKTWVWAGIVMLIMLVCIVLFYFLSNTNNQVETISIPTQALEIKSNTYISSPNEQMSNPPSPQEKQPNKSELHHNAIQNIVEIKQLSDQLIHDTNWQTNKIDRFLQQWIALTTEDQNRIRDTAWFNQLKYALIQRTAKYRAKASFGDTESLKKAQSLSGFARQLDIVNLK